MELFLGILIGAMVGSAAASVMRVRTSQGVFLNVMLGAVGAVIGGVFVGGGLSLSEIGQGLLGWSAAAAAGAIALVTIANILELFLDREAG